MSFKCPFNHPTCIRERKLRETTKCVFEGYVVGMSRNRDLKGAPKNRNNTKLCADEEAISYSINLSRVTNHLIIYLLPGAYTFEFSAKLNFRLTTFPINNIP